MTPDARVTVVRLVAVVCLVACDAKLVGPIGADGRRVDAAKPPVFDFHSEQASADLAGAHDQATPRRATIGAYYFEGWTTGDDWQHQDWGGHMTQKLLNDYPDRMPIWGWTDDTVAIMQQQIDLAADHGISFFAFDWYWQDDGQPINIPAIEGLNINNGLRLYMQAPNRNRLKFALLVANHEGFRITGTAAWSQAADYWMKYFRDPQYVHVGGRPLLFIFDPSAGDVAGFKYLQQLAQQNGLPGIAIADAGFSKVSSGDLHSQYALTSYYNMASCYACGSVQRSYTTLSSRFDYDARPTIPLVHAGFDKRPWEGPPPGGNGAPEGWHYSLDHTPHQFSTFLQQAVTWMDSNAGKATAERLLMIYAWNENGEGAYLMPTKGDPNGAWLDAVRSVVFGI